jgi:predicted amidophosphoribosyltransferase
MAGTSAIVPPQRTCRGCGAPVRRFGARCERCGRRYLWPFRGIPGAKH